MVYFYQRIHSHIQLPAKIDFLVISLFLLVSSIPLVAQNISIHAAPVGEWQCATTLSPEYHYNSVAVFLLNEDKLARLFNPANLSKAERKKTGIKSFDSVESLYFHLEMSNPKKKEDILSFPLYAFDIKPSTDFKSVKTQGKILDRITDEELNGQSLDAVARIETVQKNDFLEIAYKISSNINKLLGDRIFKKPDIWEVMQKAQHYFEDKYRNKMVAEFNVPILPSSEDYEYIIQAASLYQIKWNFQPTVKSYKNNVWSDLKNAPSVAEDKLKDKPTRLSKLRDHPYLLVVRYKSAYAIPKEQQLNVAISEDYLAKRLYNLQEFRKETIQYEAEAEFLSVLREAIDLQKNVEQYQRTKEKGQAKEALLLTIAQQYYNILSAQQQNTTQLEGDATLYHKEYYEVSYFKFFKQIDHFLFADPQIKAISQAAAVLMKLPTKPIDSLKADVLYTYLEELQPYRQITTTLEQPKGDLFYKIRDQVTQIEQVLFTRIQENLPYTREEKIERLQHIQGKYPFCAYCIEHAQLLAEELQEAITNTLRTELVSLQNQQLKYGRCFSDIQKMAQTSLDKQFPNKDALTPADRTLYEAFLQKIEGLGTIAQSFQSIATVKSADLPAEQVVRQLSTYKEMIQAYHRQICQLHHGGLLAKEAVVCLGEVCEEEMP